MDRFENGLSKEDNFDSWDIIINDDFEESQDFEIIKDLFMTEVETPLDAVSSDIEVVEDSNDASQTQTLTTDDSGEATDEEDYEDTKKSKQEIKNEHIKASFVESHATKKEPKFKRKQNSTEKYILKKKDENKKKTKKSNKKTSYPFFNSANLGALLTAFGLSLFFLNTSDKTKTCSSAQESKNISEQLINVINKTKLWTEDNIFDDDKLLEKYLPVNFNTDCLERRNLKAKILKRIDRRMKQQIRGCDLKPLKKNKKIPTNITTTTTTTATTELIGPLNKDEFNEKYSKPKSYRDAILIQNKTPDKQIDKPIISGNETTKTTKPKIELNCIMDTDMKQIIQTQGSYDILKVNSDEKPQKLNYELHKKHNCSSIYREFIRAEILFKKIMNNSYDIPKPKTPTDLAYNIENKINIITEDNINLSNIIEEQENLLKQIQDKIQYKREILQKRSQQKNILQKRLKFANWMKQKREHDEYKVQAPKINYGEKVLNNIIATNIQNNRKHALNTSAENVNNNQMDIEEHYEADSPDSFEAFNNMSEAYQSEIASLVKRKADFLKKHEELHRNMELKKRKLIDEEHMKANKLPDKSDPKRAWAKKKTEF